MAIDNTTMRRAALEYASYGWRVFPLKPKKKQPAVKGWKEFATTDEDEINKFFDQFPGCNLGVRMGPLSGIIAVDYDAPKMLEELKSWFKEDELITPHFISREGRGQLIFAWHDELPTVGHCTVTNAEGKQVGDLKIGGGKIGTLSAMPPSIHPKTGKPYRWAIAPDETEPMRLSAKAVVQINKIVLGTRTAAQPEARDAAHWKRIVDGVTEGSRNVDLTSYCGKMLSSVRDLSDEGGLAIIYESLVAIASNFDPPLPEDEVKTTFASILKAEHAKRTSAIMQVGKMRDVGNTADAATVASKNGKRTVAGESNQASVTVIKSEPPMFELHWDRFRGSGGKIVLTAQQLASFPKVREAALQQGYCALPNTIGKDWNKENGLLEQLMANCDFVESEPELKRHAVIAQRMLSIFEGGIAVMHNLAHFRKDDEGNFWFDFSELHRELSWKPDVFTRNEISRVVKFVGGSRRESGGKKLHFIDLEGIKILRKVANGKVDIAVAKRSDARS